MLASRRLLFPPPVLALEGAQTGSRVGQKGSDGVPSKSSQQLLASQSTATPMGQGGLELLVLTRKRDESIIIGDNVKITVVDIRGDQVKIGIDAPREVSVHREEIYREIQEENRRAAAAVITGEAIGELLKTGKGGAGEPHGKV